MLSSLSLLFVVTIDGRYLFARIRQHTLQVMHLSFTIFDTYCDVFRVTRLLLILSSIFALLWFLLFSCLLGLIYITVVLFMDKFGNWTWMAIVVIVIPIKWRGMCSIIFCDHIKKSISVWHPSCKWSTYLRMLFLLLLEEGFVDHLLDSRSLSLLCWLWLSRFGGRCLHLLTGLLLLFFSVALFWYIVLHINYMPK